MIQTPEEVAISVRNQLRAGRIRGAYSALDQGIASILQTQRTDDALEDIPVSDLPGIQTRALNVLNDVYGIEMLSELREALELEADQLPGIGRRILRELRLAVLDWDKSPKQNLFA